MFRKGEISIFHDIYRAVEDYPLTDEMKAVWDYDEKCEPIIKWVYGHSFYSRLVGCVCVNAGNIYKVVRQPDIYLRNKRW